MKVEKGYNGKSYIVFDNNIEAEKWEWFYCDTLGYRIACFGGYDNAYEIPKENEEFYNED